MKHLLILAFTAWSVVSIGQIKTPAPSPTCTFTQDIGLDKITVEYSRPSVKDRTIFSADGLVPHGKKWRLGANAVTKVSFSGDVTVNGNALAAGDYAVIATPSAESWEFHFHNYDGRSWSSYREKTPAVSVSSGVQMMPENVETFTIVTGHHSDESALLEFLWEKAYVALKLGFKAHDKVMENIDAVMAGPSAGEYYTAASFYHSNGKDLNKALTWINKATAGDSPKFWQVRRKALILADLGKTKEAIKAAQMSMELAEAAGNEEYVKMNKNSIADWSN